VVIPSLAGCCAPSVEPGAQHRLLSGDRRLLRL
jgi:hypothetical protein